MTGCGSLHLQAFFNPETGELLETYLSKGSQGGCNNFMIGLSRMMSLAARGGIKIESILDQLKSCGTCPSYAVRKATKGDVSLGSCCPTAVGNALKDMHKEVLERIQCCNEPALDIFNGEESEKQKKFEAFKQAGITVVDIKNKCPECGAELEHTSGCRSCPSCGFSYCG
jgi:ribonucleoside-diphosphate reductase alpha chain